MALSFRIFTPDKISGRDFISARRTLFLIFATMVVTRARLEQRGFMSTETHQ
jgi:hypothetical protein